MLAANLEVATSVLENKLSGQESCYLGNRVARRVRFILCTYPYKIIVH